MKERIAGLACMLILSTATAHATTGGPTWIVPLGYDRIHQRVYWRFETSAEVGPLTRVYYFDLEAPSQRIRFIEGHPAARLIPLVDHPGPVLTRRPQVVAIDRVRVGGVWTRRYRTGLSLPAAVLSEVQVLAFDSLAIAIPRDFEIPGRREHLFVVAFIGDPSEETYETQLPLLWPSHTKHPVLEWNLPLQ